MGVKSGGRGQPRLSMLAPVFRLMFTRALWSKFYLYGAPYGGRRQMHFSIDSPHLRSEPELKTILLWSTWVCLFCSTLPIWFTPAVSFPRYLSSHWIGTSWQARFFQTTASSLWALTWLSHGSPFSLNLQNNPVDDESVAQSGQLEGAHETVDTWLMISLISPRPNELLPLLALWALAGVRTKAGAGSQVLVCLCCPDLGNSSAAHRSFNSCAKMRNRSPTDLIWVFSLASFPICAGI